MKKLFFWLLASPVVFTLQAKAQAFDFPQSDIMKEGQFQFLSKDGFSENDGGVSAIYSVPNYQCSGEITPTVELVNYGSNLLTAALLKYSIDAQTPSYLEWQGSLEPGAVELVEFETIEVAAGPHVFAVSILEANGLADINGGNNDDLVDFYIVGISTPAPMFQQFETSSLPEGYFVENADTYGWKMYTQVKEFGNLNHMLQMPFFNCNAGIINMAYMENLDLSSIDAAELTFDIAYRYYENSGLTNYDKLLVQVSDDCGVYWSTLYEKEKDELATLPPSGAGDYFPSQANEWRTETIELNDYIGNSNVMIRFKAISGHGNNLYIDNIKVGSTVGYYDPAVQQIVMDAYPNPADTYFSIAFTGEYANNCHISVYDVFGKKHYEAPVNGNLKFNLSTATWPSGHYFLFIKDVKDRMHCSKFIVSH